MCGFSHSGHVRERLLTEEEFFVLDGQRLDVVMDELEKRAIYEEYVDLWKSRNRDLSKELVTGRVM